MTSPNDTSARPWANENSYGPFYGTANGQLNLLAAYSCDSNIHIPESDGDDGRPFSNPYAKFYGIQNGQLNVVIFDQKRK